MNIGWIYPHRRRCGITQYSLDYMNALRKAVNIIDIDPRWWIIDRKRFMSAIKNCDALHLQYDTVAFMDRSRDFYGAMLLWVKVPIIVTLHEVYDEDPAVFPRSRLGGPFPLMQLKRIVWDLRHPVQRAFERQLRLRFGARRILVHHRYHNAILENKGIPGPLLKVIPHPVKQSAALRPFGFPDLPRVNIAVPGFINPAYNYDLLFDVLEKLCRPWTFTWIGGIRVDVHHPLMESLTARVSRLGWQDRFRFTGWVDENEMTSLLASVDCVLALFTKRSSSGSLARALGAFKPVIAADLPLVSEIVSGDPASEEPPLLVAPPEAEAVVGRIERLLTDIDLQHRLYRGLSRYVEETSFERSAPKLLDLYRGLHTA